MFCCAMHLPVVMTLQCCNCRPFQLRSLQSGPQHVHGGTCKCVQAVETSFGLTDGGAKGCALAFKLEAAASVLRRHSWASSVA